jgi:hypothetical protein
MASPKPDKSTPILEADAKSCAQAWFDFFGYIDTQIKALLTAAIASSRITGTTTNDSAAAGIVGEYGEATLVVASAITLANNIPANITSISLLPGDYDVWGVVLYVPGGSTVTTQALGYIHTVSNTFPGNDSGQVGGIGGTGGSSSFLPVPQTRISLAVTTTVYLGSRVNFTSTAPVASGTIKWRRRR